MWHKIRGFIWNQYREQSADAHTFIYNDLVRDIVSRANMCMRQLSYDKCISPLLTVSLLFPPLRRSLTNTLCTRSYQCAAESVLR